MQQRVWQHGLDSDRSRERVYGSMRGAVADVLYLNDDGGIVT